MRKSQRRKTSYVQKNPANSAIVIFCVLGIIGVALLGISKSEIVQYARTGQGQAASTGGKPTPTGINYNAIIANASQAEIQATQAAQAREAKWTEIAAQQDANIKATLDADVAKRSALQVAAAEEQLQREKALSTQQVQAQLDAAELQLQSQTIKVDDEQDRSDENFRRWNEMWDKVSNSVAVAIAIIVIFTSLGLGYFGFSMFATRVAVDKERQVIAANEVAVVDKQEKRKQDDLARSNELIQERNQVLDLVTACIEAGFAGDHQIPRYDKVGIGAGKRQLAVDVLEKYGRADVGAGGTYLREGTIADLAEDIRAGRFPPVSPRSLSLTRDTSSLKRNTGNARERSGTQNLGKPEVVDDFYTVPGTDTLRRLPSSD